jgi:uncharacterized protein
MELSFKIKEIPATGAPLRVQRPVPAALLEEVLSGTEGDPKRSRAEVDVELFRDHDEVVGRGRVRGALSLPCSRCLEPATVPVDARVDLLFRREGAEKDDPKEIEGDLDQPDTFSHDGLTLSLAEPLRELLIAELPISLLCKEDCRGLCATCGANQNTPEGRACGHVAQNDDLPRGPDGPFKGLSEIKLPS